MCDCFHLAFPNWHAASSGTGAGRRLRGPEAATGDDSVCDEPSTFTEGERPRPQGSSPVEEYPETEKYTDSDKEFDAEHDLKSGSRKKTKKSGFGSMFEKRSTPKMSKLKELPSPEAGVIVKTAEDGGAEGLVYGGGGRDGIYIKEVVPESPASKSLKVKEGDQILSATVYFDNVPYEDAIQILEHAQAYKMKLCLKRKPDIAQTDPAIESDVIPEEEELYTPEMREQGKTKRRGDARISWPKFPSFGKGRKAHFTRSHSSSEADEQRKLELSPTTSDTESPIKSQDALKGKKKHKMKLSVLKKRGRISSSEDQDTDVLTTGQLSSDVQQTQESDLLSPECLESPSGETPQIYVSERLEQNSQTVIGAQSPTHKVELISIDSTLKTTDLTVALADQGSPSSMKSPDGKKKKKERSELKIKILGKDKSHKKAKSSPKRLKTLGASIEAAEQPETQKCDHESHPKQGGHLEWSASEVSPQKEKHKQEPKSSTTFKIPKVGLSGFTIEDTIQEVNINVEDRRAKTEQLTSTGKENKEDPYEKLSKTSITQTQLPKREDIEIPGMEDKSAKAKAKGIKKPKAGLTGHHEENQSETLQLSIDVDSVKEAVSKLPGYKLPKVDTSGVPIPEDITVIDANAQRISVKTPTKIVETKTKHEAHLTKFDITGSQETSKTTMKLPKMRSADFTTEELLFQKDHKFKPKQSHQESKPGAYEREDHMITGREGTQIFIPKSDGIKVEKTIYLQDAEMTKIQMRTDTRQVGGIEGDFKLHEIDGIEFIDSGDGSPAKKEIRPTIVEVDCDEKPKTEISLSAIGSKVKDVKDQEMILNISVNVPKEDKAKTIYGSEMIGKGSNIKMPSVGISLPTVREPKTDLNASKKETDVKLPELRADVNFIEASDMNVAIASVDVSIPDQTMEIHKPEEEIQSLETDVEFERQGGKFKMPKLGISMPKVKKPEVDSSLSSKDVDKSLMEAKGKVHLPKSEASAEVEIKAPEITPGDKDRQGSPLKFKMPTFKLPKLEVGTPNISVENTDFNKEGKVDGGDIKIQEEGRGVIIEAPGIDVAATSIDIKTTGTEQEESGGKFKMPSLGFSMPKVKGSKVESTLSKKDVDVALPKANADVKLRKSDLGEVDVSIPDANITLPEPEVEGKLPEAPKIDVRTKALAFEANTDEPDGKFKIPKLGIKLPKVKGPEIDLSFNKSENDAHIKLSEADTGKIEISQPEIALEVKKPEVEMQVLQMESQHSKVDIKGPEIEMVVKDTEGLASKFNKPNFSFSMPTVKGPDVQFSIPKKKTDITLSDTEVEIKFPEAPKIDISSEEREVLIPEAKVEVKKPLETDSELKGQEGKLKMPKLGITMPNIRGPEVDLSFSKNDVDVTCPEVKAEIKLPDVEVEKSSAEVDIKTPEIKVVAKDKKASALKFKMPTFTLPTFAVGSPSVTTEIPDKDVKMDGADVGISNNILTVEIEPPSIDVKDPSMDVKTTKSEHEGKGGTFKLPSLGFKAPHVDLSLSKKDVDTKLPDVDVEKSSAEVEINAPEIKVFAKDTKESPSKFKMPTLKFPKFGVSTPGFSAEVPDMDKDVKIDEADIKIPEKVLRGEIDALSIDAKGPSVDIKTQGTKKEERRGSKFKLPSLGFKSPSIDISKKEVTLPEVKAKVKLPDDSVAIQPPECEAKIDGEGGKIRMAEFGMTVPKEKGSEIDLKFGKKDFDAELPEVNLPDVKHTEPSADVKESPIKYQLPAIAIPKFGASVSVEAPDMDKEVNVQGAKLTVPEVEAVVDIGAQNIDIESQSLDVQKTGISGKGKESKFQVPKFDISLPKVQGPNIDLSLSKKNVKLSEVKGRVELPEAPEVDIDLGSINASIPETKIEMEKPDMDIKPFEIEGRIDGQETKFKIPNSGITMPKVQGPEVDLNFSSKDVNVAQDVSLSRADIPLAQVEIKDTEIGNLSGSVKGSPSKFKMPTFKFPKFGVTTPNASAEIPDKDIQIKGSEMHISVPHTNVDVPEVKAEICIPEIEPKKPLGSIVADQKPSVESDAKQKKPRFSMPRLSFSKPSVKVPDVGGDLPDVNIAIPEGKAEVKGREIKVKPLECEVEGDGQGSQFNMPKLGIKLPKLTGPEVDSSFQKKNIDVSLPEAKAEVKLPDTEAKKASAEVDINLADIKITAKDTDGSPSKFKMPTFKLPKFGVSSSSASAEVPEMDKDVKIHGAAIKIPEDVLMVNVEAPSIDTKPLTIDVKMTGSEQERRGSKFKFPSLGFKGPEIDLSSTKKDVDVTIPEVKAEVKLADVEVQKPPAEVEIKSPEIKLGTTEESPSRFKMPTFKIPKFGVGSPSVSAATPDMDKDVKIDGADIKIPEEVLTVEIDAPGIETNVPSIDIKMKGSEQERRGSKFKFPSFGFKGPDVDMSKKDVDVILPEVKAAVQFPKVEVKPSAEVDIKAPDVDVKTSNVEGSPSKLNFPTFKLPKFGVATPEVNVEVPDVDKDIKVDAAHLTKERVKVEVKPPDVEIKEPTGSISFSQPPMAESDVKSRKTSWTMPRFSFSKASGKAPEADMNVDVPKVDVMIPEVTTDMHLDIKEGPSISVEGGTAPDFDAKLKKPRFSLPKISFSKQSSKDTEVDVTLPKVDVSLPEGKVEVKQPEIELKQPEGEIPLDGQKSKFKFPSLGFKGPEMDLSLTKKNVDVTLPEINAEVKLPDAEVKHISAGAEVKSPEIKLATSITDTSPSKFKMPTFKIPKFGVGSANVTAEVPDMDKDIKIGTDVKIPEDVLTAEIEAPSIDTKAPSLKIETKGSEQERRGSKFKLPSFGFKGPDVDITKKEIDVTVPEVKADVKLPNVEVKKPSEMKSPEIKLASNETEESPSKFKMPTFKIPKFGVGSPSVSAEVPDMEKDVKIDGADIKIPEEVLTVNIEAPSIDTKAPAIDIKMTGSEQERRGSKFKFPSFGFKGPDVDITKTDVGLTLPEVKAEVKLPNVEVKKPSAEVEIKSPEIKLASNETEESPSKFKMPTFKIPKFGVGSPSVSAEVPDMEKDVKIDGADIKIPEEVLTVNIEAPSIDTKAPAIDIKMTGSEQERRGSKFKFPTFGFKGPDVDITKTDVGLTLPEVKAEVKLPNVEVKKPSAEVEIKSPEIKLASNENEESPSKFKMPTFKIPKFGVGSPSVSAEVPDMEKDVKIDGADIKIPEEVLTVNIEAPSIDTKAPAIDIKMTGSEQERRGSKFKFPSFGFKGPDVDITKTDVGLTLPEVKAEVKLPNVEVKKPSAEVEIKSPEIKLASNETEESPSKFKMPTFKIPKFGVGSPSVSAEVPDMEKDVKIDGADIKIPEEVLTVNIEAPSIDTKAPAIDIKMTGSEQERRGSKFKFPSFGFKAPDVEIPKKDVDVTLPDIKAEVKLPNVEVKKSSVEVELKSPEIKLASIEIEESPSKFKMPTFKIPKFGVVTPNVSAEVPDMDKDVKIEEAAIKIPEGVSAVKIEAPHIDTKAPAIDIKMRESEKERRGSKFKFPSLGFKGPDHDISNKDVDVILPEVKAEVKLPEVEVKKPSAEMEVKSPEIKLAVNEMEVSPSKFKMPAFKLPKFGVGSPSISAEVPEMDKDVKAGTDLKTSEEVLTVNIEAPRIDTKVPSIDIETKKSKQESRGSIFKLPSLGFRGPDVDISMKDVDVMVPEVEAEVKLPTVEVKKPSAEVEIKPPGIDVKTSNVEGSPSKLKLSTFKLPKFGVATPEVNVEVPDVNQDTKVDGADLKIEGAKVEVKLPDVEIKEPTGSISVSQPLVTEGDVKSRKTSWTMPRFSFSKASGKAPEADMNVDVPKVDVMISEVTTDMHLDIKEAPSISVEGGTAPDFDAKLKKPRFSLPKISFSKQSSKDTEVDVTLPKVDVSLPEGKVEVKQPEIELKQPEGEIQLDGQKSKFKFPSLGFKGPEIDLGLTKKDIDVTLPEINAEVKLPEVEVKKTPAEVEMKSPERKLGTTEESPSRFKLPTFKMPKFGVGSPSVSAEVHDMDKDIKIDGADIKIPEEVLTVEIDASSIETKVPVVDIKMKGSEQERRGSKFKFPSFGFKGPDVDISKREIGVTLPEGKAEVEFPDVELKQPSADIEIKASGIDLKTNDVEGSPSKLNFPTFKLPKFGVATPDISVEVPHVDKDIKVDEANLKLEGLKAEVKLPEVEIKEPTGSILVPQPPMAESDVKSRKTSWTMPRFSFSKASGKAPEADMNVDVPKVDVMIPEVTTDMHLDIKEAPSISVEGGTAPEFDVKLKKPRFSLPKISFSKQSSKDTEVDVSLPKVDVSLPEGKVEVKQPEIELKQPEGEIPLDGQKSKFKFPSLGFKGPEIDLSLTKKNVDVTLPEINAEVKLPHAEIEKASAGVEVKSPEINTATKDTVESPTKFKMPTFKLPKFGVGSPSVTADMPDLEKDIRSEVKNHEEVQPVEIEAPSIDTHAPSIDLKTKSSEQGRGSKVKFPSLGFQGLDVDLSKKDADVTLTEVQAEVKLPDIEVRETGSTVSPADEPILNAQAKMKRPSWTFPRFSFSKSSGMSPDAEVHLERPDIDVLSKKDKAEMCIPDNKEKGHSVTTEVRLPEIKAKAPEVDIGHEGHESILKLPKIGTEKVSQKDVGGSLPEVKVEGKFSKGEVQVSGVKSKDSSGSPLKLQMLTTTKGKFGGASNDVILEAPGAGKDSECEETNLKGDVTVLIKGPSLDIKSEVSKVTVSTSESPLAETGGMGLGSPSKFKLPSFKMPRLSFSRSRSEEEYAPVDTEHKEDPMAVKTEPKEESKSPKVMSLGKMLTTFDVEFDVPKAESIGDDTKISKEDQKTDEAVVTKSPEKTGWFNFTRFGLSSPSEPSKTSDNQQKDKKSPAGETGDEDVSPTCSVQSSDAFADISSTVTSEPGGPSLSSPTKVTVKYSNPNPAVGLEGVQSNIVTSTAVTELMSDIPNLPEKITILSSGVSSSSEDTLRLDSGKIHVITSNIQATPESQQAKLMTAVQIQPSAGLFLTSEVNEAAAWTVEDSQVGKRTVFERHLLKETSSDRSESKETIVVTKQITRVFESSEPISGDTASSIQRLRHSVHSDKMKFFEEAEK